MRARVPIAAARMIDFVFIMFVRFELAASQQFELRV
jgi:hypothetical protein